MPLQIVVVEDTDTVREALVDYLQTFGWDVHACANGSSMDDVISDMVPDVVLLDLNLPGEDGLSITRRLRASRPGVGIIILSARAAPPQRAAGYEYGADVYLTKPADLLELSSAIKSLARRVLSQSHTGRLGDWVLDLRSHCLLRSKDQVRISLTSTETMLLKRLVESPSREASTDILFDEMTRDVIAFPSRNALNITISRLRNKLAPHLGVPDCLKSLRGFGYRLTVPIRVRT